MLVIGIAGPVCAGKSTLARFIEKNVAGSVVIGLSEYVKREVKLSLWRRLLRRQPIREDYAAAASRLLALRGPGGFAKLFLEDEKIDGASVVVVDGMRMVEAHRHLSEVCSEYVLLWVYADRTVRWRRSVNRGRFDERGISLLRFLLRENEGFEALGAELREHADMTFNNDGSFYDLAESARKLVADARWLTQD